MIRTPETSLMLGLLTSAVIVACGGDAREERTLNDAGSLEANADSEGGSDSPTNGDDGGGAGCEFVAEANLCKLGNESCCTLRGHAYELDSETGCRRRLDAQEWNRILCVAQPCIEGPALTCYKLATEEGGQVLYLGNNDVTGPIEQAGLSRCDDETEALLMGSPDCP